MTTMKSILTLFSAMVCAMSLLAAPVAAQAAGVRVDGLGLSLVLGLAQQDDDRHRRHRDEDYRPQDNPRRDDDRRQDGGGARDNRINRAIAIAQSRGRVLDAGPQGGSVFWVRVATDRGRVDLLIDADTGQIVGQR